MQKKKILVLTDTLPWGHRSIAKAIYGYLKDREKEENFKVEWAEIEATSIKTWNDIYVFYYRFFPEVGKVTHGLIENKFLRERYLETMKCDLPELINKMKKSKPDLVISAYFMHSQVLAKWRANTGAKFKLWTVVADPWESNAMSFVPKADLNLVYDEVLEKKAIKIGVSRAKILKTGWWTREEMFQKKSKVESLKVKRKLGFNDDRPIVFVGGGSLGTGALVKLLPALMATKNKIGIIFNTGIDKLAFNMLEEYIKLFKKIRKDDTVQIKNMGWIDNMAETLSACDIVFGKAGPNFLFDVIAVEKPFVAITHIGGQEDKNIELIKKRKLGWVKEEGNSAAEFLLSYLKNPPKYNDQFVKTIALEAERNKKSLLKILERVKVDLMVN